MAIDYAGRVSRLREAMSASGVDAVMLSVGSDLPYLLGYQATPMERLTMAVVPAEGEVVLMVPELEHARVELLPEVFATRPWAELEDPVSIVADLAKGAGLVAIGDHTWSRFLLALQAALPLADFTPAGPLLGGLRARKDAEEIDRLRDAGAAADRVAHRLATERFSGRTERELARWVAQATVDEGQDVAAFTIVASGPNSASPHHEPGERVIAPGDTVVVDFGGTVGGYHSDTTRTFSVGEPSDEVGDAHRALYAAQDAGVSAVTPGVSAESIDAATRAVLDDAGYGDYFIHRTGHGIGLEVHEDPYIIEGNPTVIEPGMAFSVEPGIYVAGRFGMRIEDIVVATPTGVERLNQSPRDLVVVV